MKNASAYPARVFVVLIFLAIADRLQADTKISDAGAPPTAHLAVKSAEKLALDVSDAAQLVRSALVAEARGDVQARSDLLREAIGVDSSYGPAHWHSGEVRLDGQWMPIDAAAAATVRKGTMGQYRQLRNRTAGTAAAHIKLANWCATVELKDQERTHLIYATYLRPSEKQRREIFSKLSLVRYRGLLIPQTQVDAVKSQAKDGPTLARERNRLIANIKRDLAGRSSGVRESILNELRSTPNSLRVAVLESILQENRLATAIADEGIAVLAAEPGQAATNALARQAVFGQQESTRKAAAKALQTKSLFAYVPTLVSALQSPVDVQLNVYWIGNVPQHELFMYQQGSKADYSFASIGGGQENVNVITHRISHQPTDVRVTVTPDRTLQGDALRAQQALAANEANVVLNQRIGAALNVASLNGGVGGMTITKCTNLRISPSFRLRSILRPPSLFRFMCKMFPVSWPVRPSGLRPGQCPSSRCASATAYWHKIPIPGS